MEESVGSCFPLDKRSPRGLSLRLKPYLFGGLGNSGDLSASKERQ